MRFFHESILRSPDNEGGADDTILENDNVHTDGESSDVGDPSDSGEPAEAAPQEKLTVREQLKKAIAETSEPQQKPKADKGKRFGDRKPAVQEASPETPPEPPKPAIQAPDSLSKEAKAEWDKTPRALQEAFIKREQDMQKGVDELKNRYSMIDSALAEHTDALRQMNATPGEAVSRMFLWFKALANNPVQSFPGLAKSMGMDWNKLTAAITGGQQQPPQQQQQNPNQGAPEVPEPVRNYVTNLENQIRQLNDVVRQVQTGYGSIQQDMAAQNDAKTRENLAIWSKDKPHFEEVRQDMARLIQADPALIKNGQVDLDSAYERAIYYNPEVRAKVLAAQQQANQQVQQAEAAAATTAKQGQVAKARKAAVSIPSTNAPGNPAAAASKKPRQRMSVGESLRAAIAELRDQ